MLKSIVFDHCLSEWIQNRPSHPAPYRQFSYWNDDGTIPGCLDDFGYHENKRTYPGQTGPEYITFDEVDYPFPEDIEITVRDYD